MSFDEITQQRPRITQDDIRAALIYAADKIRWIPPNAPALAMGEEDGA